MVGIDPGTDFTVGPWLANNLQRPLADDEIILGANAHIFLGKSESHPGDEEYFYGKKFTVAGILDPTGIGIDDAGFVSLNAAYDMARGSDVNAIVKLDVKPGQVSAFMVSVNQGADRSDVANRIEVQVPGVAVVSSRELNLMTFGEETAAHLGVEVERFKRRVLLTGSLATAAAVSVAGIIGFVGLVVPHLARRLVGPDHRTLIPLAGLFGAALMIASDTLVRVWLNEMPVGVVTSIVGAPVFCLLLRKRRATAW